MDNKDLFLSSEQVRLRAFREDDLADLYAYVSHAELVGRRYLPWSVPKSEPLTEKHIQASLEEWGERERRLTLAVTSVDSDTVIGHIGAGWRWDPWAPGIGMAIAVEHQRKGFGSEALQLMLKYLFESLPANNVSAWIDDWNGAGLRFCGKQGFKSCGTMRRAGLRKGAFYGSVTMDMLRREWVAMQKGGNNGS